MVKKSIKAKNNAKRKKAIRKSLYKWTVRIAVIVLMLVFLAFMIYPMFIGQKTV